jgi:hypothetical protein
VLQIIVRAKDSRKAVAELELQKIVQILNDSFDKDDPVHAEANANLLELVKAWQDAKLAPRTPFEHQVDAPVPVVMKMKWPPGCPNWAEIERRCKPYLVLAGTGAYPFVHYSGEKPWKPWDFAISSFIQLVTIPERERDKFAGPCRRCQNYYIKKRASQKVYCSRVCGNAATAVIRTRERWDQERGKRLEQATKALREWSRPKTTEPFKEWAAKRYPDLSKKFLTRAINKQELPEPRRERG